MGSAGSLRRYGSQNIEKLLEQVTRNSIGMDDYLSNVFSGFQETNYPPYNLIQISNTESRLELALAGFKQDEVNVYTEYGRIVVEGKKEKTEEESEYLHRGLAQRSFQRAWALSEDITVKDVNFADGLLTIKLGKIVPEHHARKTYL